MRSIGAGTAGLIVRSAAGGSLTCAKNAEAERPDRHEIENAIETLGRALLVLRARNLNAEVDDGERILHALQRMGVRLR